MPVGIAIANHAVAGREVVVLGPIRKAVPLPIVNVVIFHPFNSHGLEVFNIRIVGNIDRATSLGTRVRRGHDVSKLVVIVVAAARANPYAKIRTKLLNQAARRRQALGELGIERPEAILVDAFTVPAVIILAGQLPLRRTIVVPAVVHNIGLERTNASLRKLLIDGLKGLDDVLVIDEHHVVEPGVVLNAEVAGLGNLIDIREEVSLHNIHIRAIGACCTANGLPRDVLTIRGQLAIALKVGEILSGPIAGATHIVNDLGIRLGELGTKEHTVDVDRLTKNGLRRVHLNNALGVGNSPLLIGVGHVEMLAIDIADAGFLIISFKLEPLTHVMLVVIHDNLHLKLSVGIGSELERLEIKGYHFAGFALGFSDLNVFNLKRACLNSSLIGFRNRSELAIVECNFGASGKRPAGALGEANADIAGVFDLFVEAEVDHLRVFAFVRIGIIDLEGALLVVLVKKVILVVRSVDLKLLRIAVGVRAVRSLTTGIADGLESHILARLAAIECHVYGHLVDSALFALVLISRMEIRIHITIDKGLRTIAVIRLIRRRGYRPGFSLITGNDRLVLRVVSVELRNVHCLVSLAIAWVIAGLRAKAKLTRADFRVEDNLLLTLVSIFSKLAGLYLDPFRAVPVIERIIKDATRAVVLCTLVVTRSVFNFLDRFSRAQVQNERLVRDARSIQV